MKTLCRYSVEKFPDGVTIVYFHSVFGVMPYIALRPDELDSFIDMLQSCQTKNIFKEEFKENF